MRKIASFEVLTHGCRQHTELGRYCTHPVRLCQPRAAQSPQRNKIKKGFQRFHAKLRVRQELFMSLWVTIGLAATLYFFTQPFDTLSHYQYYH